MIELKSPATIDVRFEGQTYKLSKAKVGVAKEFEARIKASEHDEPSKIQVVIDFLVKSGLPLEVVCELDVEVLEPLLEALMPPKKKS